MTTESVESIAARLLTPEDRRRVEVYFKLTDQLDQILPAAEGVTEALGDVLNDPDTSEEAKAAAKESFRETSAATRELLELIGGQDIARKLPSPEMIRTYALVEMARVVDTIRTDISEIKSMLERGLM